MNPSYSPSDLIELFLDGEANAEERRMLFDALGRDPALNMEFEDAVRLRSILARETQQAVPAAALGAAIVGSIAAMEHSEQFTPAPLASIASPFGSALMGTTLRRTLAILAGVVICVETSYILSQLGSPSAVDSQTSVLRTEHNSSGGVIGNSFSNVAATTKQHSRTQSPIAVNQTTVAIVDSSEGARDVVLPAISRTSPMANDAALPTTSTLPQIVQDVHCAKLEPEDSSSESFAWIHHVSANLRAVRMLIPPADHVLDNADQHDINNIALDLGYALSTEQTVGISIGRETFPLVITHEDGDRTERPSLFWVGAMYRWTPAALAITRDIRPFGDATLGGGERGPVMRATLGAEWQPDTRTNFTLGVESLGLAYRNNQSWHTAGKLSLALGVGLRF